MLRGRIDRETEQQRAHGDGYQRQHDEHGQGYGPHLPGNQQVAGLLVKRSDAGDGNPDALAAQGFAQGAGQLGGDIPVDAAAHRTRAGLHLNVQHGGLFLRVHKRTAVFQAELVHVEQVQAQQCLGGLLAFQIGQPGQAVMGRGVVMERLVHFFDQGRPRRPPCRLRDYLRAASGPIPPARRGERGPERHWAGRCRK